MIEEVLLRVARAPGSTISCWRGNSGRRYVVGVHPLHELPELARDSAIALAVYRDGRGFAQLVATAPMHGIDALAHEIARQGVSEIHLHRLADTPARRAEALADLTQDLG